jgi:hypothetical protein
MAFSGGCLCNAVRFQVEAPSLWCAHCHCTQCQRAHGAAFVTWVGFNEADVEIIDADSQLIWFASSPPARRGFCGRCGSTLFFKSSRWPAQLHVTRAAISTSIDRVPEGHAFYDTHVDWVVLADDLAKS